jgi:hypothetical protein
VTINLTAAQARALGLDVPAVRQRLTRKALARAGAVSTCVTCGEQFTTAAAETRHVAATLHARYDCDTDRA